MPNWTPEQYAKFAAASRRNPPRDYVPDSIPKRPLRDEPLATEEGAGEGSPRFRVVVRSYRVRLVDPDNLCPKSLIDCLRYGGVLPEDSPDIISLRTEQCKVSSYKDERTEIEITPIKETQD